MTVNTRIVSLLMRRDDVPFIPLQEGLRLQVLPSIAFLPTCQKHQCAAFIQDLAILVVWDDEPRDILKRAERIEAQLMKTVWHSPSPMMDEKGNKSQSVLVTEVQGSEDEAWHEELSNPPRRIVLIQAILTALTLVLIVAALGSGWRNVAIEIAVDRNLIRMAFIVVWPLQFWLAMVRLSSITMQFEAHQHALVFHAKYRRLFGTVLGSHLSSRRKLEILLRKAVYPPSSQPPPSRHNTMSCIQRRSTYCHRAYRQVIENRHCYI